MNTSVIDFLKEIQETWAGTESQEEILEFLQILSEKNKETAPAENLRKLIENPPEEDTKLQNIYKTPFVSGDIVLAGSETRKIHPLTHLNPIHFKKSYLQKLSRWETTATHEAIISQHIWDHFQQLGTSGYPTPLPLGATSYTYRSQLLPAKTLGSLSPISLPLCPNNTLRQILAAKQYPEQFLPLWKKLEELNALIDLFHQGGFLHHDLHRENLMVEEENKTHHLIDFETSEEDERFHTAEWAAATLEDKKLFIQEASLILLCLPQPEIPSTAFLELVEEEIEKNSFLSFLKKKA
jgi:serine/threonine protein kinase